MTLFYESLGCWIFASKTWELFRERWICRGPVCGELMVCQRPVMGQFYIALHSVFFYGVYFYLVHGKSTLKSIPVFLCVRVSVLVWFCCLFCFSFELFACKQMWSFHCLHILCIHTLLHLLPKYCTSHCHRANWCLVLDKQKLPPVMLIQILIAFTNITDLKCWLTCNRL